MPKIGLGLGSFGGGRTPDHSNDAADIRIIQAALALGYTHLDASELSGGGHTEELVASAIKGFERQRLIIATKAWKAHLGYSDLLKAAEGSLQRLQANYIDLYYLHYPAPDIPISETMRAMDRLVDEGMVKNIAVSNFPLDLLLQAQSFANHKIVADQIELSLLTREKGQYGTEGMESRILPYCQTHDVLVVAERPLERGALLAPNSIMAEMERKYQKTRAQIALNWLVSHKNVAAIPMTHNADHLRENLEATGWTMNPEDTEKLGGAYQVT